MQVATDVWNEVKRTTRERIEDVVAAVNDAYYKVLEDLLPQEIAEEIELDMSTADDETGLYLPSNLIAIATVYDENNDNIYYPRDEARKMEDAEGNLWYFSEILKEPYEEVTGITLAHNDSVFTVASALTESYEDEWVRFGSCRQYFKITGSDAGYTQFSFTPIYRGRRIESSNTAESVAQIRPAMTKKLALESAGSSVTDVTVKVYYWAYPPLLYEAYDAVLCPVPELLSLRAIADIVGKWHKMPQAARRYDAEYQAGLAEARARFGAKGGFTARRDTHGELFSFTNTDMYDDSSRSG